MLHVLADESGNLLTCGRACTKNYERVAAVPSFLYPVCNRCLQPYSEILPRRRVLHRPSSRGEIILEMIVEVELSVCLRSVCRFGPDYSGQDGVRGPAP